MKLEKWAKYEKIWFDHADIRENWKRIDNGDSREAEVYGFEETKTVRKVFRYDALDSDYTPTGFINDRISVHNALFPTTKYELFGFTQTDKGFFAFILEQPFIDGAERPTKEEIKEYMKLRGFPNNDGNSYHWNDYYVVGDLHTGNVLKVKDEAGSVNMFVIDPVPYLNTPDEKSGKSKYLQFRIVKNRKSNK